jgi:FixJ family two-component response regulator
MVFLVMQEASEQGFGVAIKISSAGLPVPLVAAGPAWTRTMVLKAVKYGACDILITPSSSDDIREKIEVNLIRKAA